MSNLRMINLPAIQWKGIGLEHELLCLVWGKY